MTTFSSGRRMVARVTRWTARILAAAVLALFVMFAVGEGLPPLSWQFAALLTVLVGCVLAWFCDLSAGALIVLGTAAFYAINFANSGKFPGGWVFPLLFVPGVLLLLSFAMGRFRPSRA